jgi:hypothetical protein
VSSRRKREWGMGGENTSPPRHPLIPEDSYRGLLARHSSCFFRGDLPMRWLGADATRLIGGGGGPRRPGVTVSVEVKGSGRALDLDLRVVSLTQSLLPASGMRYCLFNLCEKGNGRSFSQLASQKKRKKFDGLLWTFKNLGFCKKNHIFV